MKQSGTPAMRKIEVNRRNFIKVMTGGSSIFLIPSVLGECSNGDSKIWLEGRKGPTAVTLSAPVETPTTDNQHSEVSICVARASTGRERPLKTAVFQHSERPLSGKADIEC